MKSLPENFNWDSSNDFCWITFLFIWIEHFNFLSLNFRITLFLFFSWWHMCKSSGATSCPFREMALHTASSRMLSPILRSTGLTSRDSLWWYWALVTAFRSNWIMCWCRRVLQFFVIKQSGFNFSCLASKVSNLSFKALTWQLMLDIWRSSSISSQILNLASCEHHINTNKLLNVKII